jgi:hypothetical protein
MLGRIIFHVFVLTALMALGVWLIYKDLFTTSEGNFTTFSGMLAAMFWFGFLIYALLVTLLFLRFKWRTWKSFFIAHLFCAAIGMLCTAAVVTRGQLRAERHLRTAEAGLEANPQTQATQSPETEAPRHGASPMTTAPQPETDLAVTPGTSPQGLDSEPSHTERGIPVENNPRR